MSTSPATATKHHRFDWRAELLVLSLTTAEAAVLWLLVDLALATTHDETRRVSALPVFALLYVGTALPRWLDALDVWDRDYSAAIAIGIAVSTLVATKTMSFPDVNWTDSSWIHDSTRALIGRPNAAFVPVWWTIGISAYAWWRGKTRADPGPDAATSMLRNGTIVGLLAAAGQSGMRTGGATRETSGAVLVFFTAALAGVVFSRMRADSARLAAPMSGRWIGSMLAPVIAVVFAAVVIAGVLSRDLLDTILLFLAPLVWGLSVVFRIIILTLAVIAFIIVSPILWFLSTHPIDFAGIHIQPVRGGPEETFHDAVRRSSHVPDSIRYLVAAFVLLLLFTGVTRLALRRRKRQVIDATEERTSVLNGGDLLALLKSLFAPFLPKRTQPHIDPLAALRDDPVWVNTVAIREAYSQYLVWSREHGYPRSEGMTPSEHRRSFTRRISEQQDQIDLVTLTDGYNVARYDRHPATREQAAMVGDAWRRLYRNNESEKR